MLWRCPACNRQTEEPVCGRCQTPMSEGEPSAATGLMKETAGSVVFLIAVICFTAAVLFSAVSSFLVTKAVSLKEVKTVVTEFAEATGTSLNPYALKAVSTVYETLDAELSAESQSGSLPLGNLLAVVGLWLVVAQGYSSRVNFRRGGPIVLKIAAVTATVGSCIVIVCGALLGAGLWFGRADLVAALSAGEEGGLPTAFKNLLSCEATMWMLLALCGVLLLCGLVYLFFFASATRVLNSILHTARTGDFGKRAGGFAAFALCVAALCLLADAAGCLLTADLSGIGSLLYAVAYGCFGVLLYVYRHRAQRLSWEQPAFTGETAAAMPGIPTGLKASDLMSEPAARPAAPMTVPTAPVPSGNNPQAPKRTLNEPFTEESMEPQAMTGNGVCPKCGTPIPDNAFFCLRCGHKFK